jgi:hypothetical protein
LRMIWPTGRKLFGGFTPETSRAARAKRYATQHR